MIQSKSSLASTGIEGLDQILGGGLPTGHLYLVEGDPGTGKTTMALQFLLAGVAAGETCLYISLSESKEELAVAAESHGWSIDGFKVVELHPPPSETLSPDEHFTLFHASEIELADVLKNVLDEVERTQPSRIIFDSLSEMRILASDPMRYRRQILALKQFFNGRSCTALMLEDKTWDAAISPHQLHSLSHGVILLDQITMNYGAKRRRLSVAKLRGVDFTTGYHDFAMRRGGIVVFPRLVAGEHDETFTDEVVSSGVAGFDALLGGGLDRGTTSLIIGAAGTGKTSICLRFACTLANKGEKTAMYTFDEGKKTLLDRADRLGMGARKHVQEGLIDVRQIDPAEIAPGEFIHMVRTAVKDGATAVVVDSLNGYLNAMPQERYLVTQMHELFSFLNNMGVLSFLVVSQTGLLGHGVETPIDVSYLADTVVLLRYFENNGEVCNAISVVKKRSGEHERTIRQFLLRGNQLQVGEPITEFVGILSGNPQYLGKGHHI
ncbi:MAG: AAA family ATPase [Pseudobdellovibrionaceae bacterium]|nr:AAA family ATPase [Pseudobdellovibrionaceae bacterium]